MSFFSTTFMTSEYNSALSQSAQGQLSSQYTAALTGEIQSAAIADFIGFLLVNSYGASVADAIAAVQAIEAGAFTLNGLFGAAQSKSGTVDGPNVADPTPTLTLSSGALAGTTIDLTAILGGLDTETWTTTQGNGKKLDTIYHTREFYTSTHEPSGYDPDWSVLNHDPEPTPLSFELIEDTPFTTEIDLLTGATDPDGDPLSLLAGSFSFTVDGNASGQPPFISIVDGVVTVDTSHPSLQPGGAYDLLDGKEMQVVLTYQVEDGNGGSTETSLTLNITGTADTYTATESLSFTKTGGDATERSFSGTITVNPEGFDATVTVTGNADLTASNEILTVTVDGDQFVAAGTGTNPPNPETLSPYAGTITLQDTDFADGSLSYSAVFTQQVANGSTVNLDLEYSYIA